MKRRFWIAGGLVLAVDSYEYEVYWPEVIYQGICVGDAG
jgi:hypothetical protein